MSVRLTSNLVAFPKDTSHHNGPCIQSLPSHLPASAAVPAVALPSGTVIDFKCVRFNFIG